MVVGKNNYFLFFTVFFLIVVFLFFFISFYILYQLPLTVAEFPVRYSVSNISGFKLDNTSELDFGIVASGSSVTRTVTMTNTHAFPVRFSLVLDPPSDLISADVEKRIFAPGENHTLSFSLVAPLDYPPESYEGVAHVVIWRVRDE